MTAPKPTSASALRNKEDFLDSIRKAAAGNNIDAVDTGEAIESLRFRILESCYGRSEGLDQKIRALYKRWYKQEWEEEPGQAPGRISLGPSGLGKTTSYVVAARQVAEGLGMNFVYNPTDDYAVNLEVRKQISELQDALADASLAGAPPEERLGLLKKLKSAKEHLFLDTSNDFVFVMEQFTGVTNSAEVGGIPGKAVLNGKAYMIKLASRRLMALNYAGAGVLLLDDFLNANTNMQAVGMSLMLDHSFQDLKLDHVYIGMTGNLGALDGNKSANLVAALRSGRAELTVVLDTLRHLEERMSDTYADELGDLGLMAFLSTHPEYFYGDPLSSRFGPYATPRGYTQAIRSMRQDFRRLGGAENPLNNKVVTAVTRDVAQAVGTEAARDYQVFYHGFFHEAIPLASEVMTSKAAFEVKVAKVPASDALIEGEDVPLTQLHVNKEFWKQMKGKLGKHYNTSTFSPESRDFAKQFTLACTDLAFREIEAGTQPFDVVMDRLCRAYMTMGATESDWADGFNHLFNVRFAHSHSPRIQPYLQAPEDPNSPDSRKAQPGIKALMRAQLAVNFSAAPKSVKEILQSVMSGRAQTQGYGSPITADTALEMA